MRDYQTSLSAALVLATEVLVQTTGLSLMEAKLVASYYTATHYALLLNLFPALALIGPPGSGKSTILECANGLCYRPEFFEGSQITTASLRDKLADAHEGTAVIDEAHGEKCALEELLLLRYRRETAVVDKQVPDALGGWENRSFPIFGPTILARRTPIADGALESRSIILKTRPASRPPLKPSQGQLPVMMESFQSYASAFPELPEKLDDKPVFLKLRELRNDW